VLVKLLTFVLILMSLFQAKDGDWFILATNLAPCVGVRVHLWPDSAKSGDLPDYEIAVEVTTKMAEIPTGPTQRQVFSLLKDLIHNNYALGCCTAWSW